MRVSEVASIIGEQASRDAHMDETFDEHPAPYDGYKVAEAMGLEAWLHLRGDDGAAYFLEDGRIMKICGEREASLFLALAKAQGEGVSHPGVPRVHEMARFEQRCDMSQFGLPPAPYAMYAVVRDDFRDLDFDDRWEKDKVRLWHHALYHLSYGWIHGIGTHVDEAIRLWSPQGPEIDQLLSSLEHVEATTGRRVGDIRMPNIGLSPTGEVGMRDLGRHDGPKLELDALLELPVLELSSPASDRSPPAARMSI